MVSVNPQRPRQILVAISTRREFDVLKESSVVVLYNSGDCDMGSSEYLFDEMPFMQPRNDGRNAIYMGEPREQKGIHCRFGMKGVIAENHFDATRNAIAVLGGRRRYILSHPKNCPNLSLLPKGHDSARHSEVDYANPDLERFPEFAEALANEVILEAGESQPARTT